MSISIGLAGRGGTTPGLIIGCALLFLMGCEDDDKANAAHDAAVADMHADAAVADMQADAAVADIQADTALADLQADAALADMQASDGPADSAPADVLTPDAGSIDAQQPDMTPADQMAGSDIVLPGVPLRTILYLTGANYQALTAKTIKSDGTAAAAAQVFPNSLEFSRLYLGRSLFPSVDPSSPGIVTEVEADFRAVKLPANKGLVLRTRYAGKQETAFYLVKPDGKVSLLDKFSSHGKVLTFNQTSTVFAVYYLDAQKYQYGFKLIRVDGKKFKANNSTVCTLVSAVQNLWVPYPEVPVFSNGKLWFRGKIGKKQYLLSAPLDCTGKASIAKLAQVGGASPVYIGEMLLSADGNSLLFTAGNSYWNNDILVVDTKTGACKNITKKPGSYANDTIYLFADISLSPKNKYMAYSRRGKVSPGLYIRATGLSKPEVKISTPVNYSTKGSLSWFFEALHWDSDDDLLFWAGVTQNGDYGADMYHLKVSTGLVTNLTKTGGLTRPFSKAGELRPNGAWISPNGKYYYFKKCDKQLFCSIGSLERSTLKYKDIMPGLVMGYSHRAAPEFLDAPAGKPELVFLEAAKK